MRSLLGILLAGAALAAGACSKPGPAGKAEAPLERCAEAREGTLESLHSVHVAGTYFRFETEETGTKTGESFDLYLRLPDRARFSFTLGRSNRIVLLRGEDGEERPGSAAEFSPLEGDRLLEWRRSRLLHVVAARFPVLPPPLEVSEETSGARVRDGDLSLRVDIDPTSSLPSLLHFESEGEAISLADWRTSGHGPLFPHLLRCEAGGTARWEERIRSWSENPNLLDRLFDAPGTTALASAPTLGEPRIREERAFELVAEMRVGAFTQVASVLSRIRSGRLADAKPLILLDRDRKLSAVALVATVPGIQPTRTVPEGQVAEVFVRGTLADALEWIGQLESFAREEGHEPEGGARLMREPSGWEVGGEDEGAADFRIILPVRPG
ncbi:MAG: hypothetical protein L0323_14010 [Planctomycetes bacterium]|nr:hypothetical protein [Planctomycetota bacterium]